MTGRCEVENCDRPVQASGLCVTHYGNWRKYGHAVPVREWPLERRLYWIGWTVTDAGCWEWNGRRNADNYAVISSALHGLNKVRVHRLMYGIFCRPISDEEVLRHSCDNPPCVNPAHLIPGTHADNMADMVERQRHWKHRATHCPNGHDRTLPGAIRIIGGKKPQAICVECARARGRRYKQRRVSSLPSP